MVMKQLIKRESLVSQVVKVLKRDLPHFIHGKWLPGERELSHKYYVSRNTIRAALVQMQRQGLIRVHPKRGYRILASLREHNEKKSRLICYLAENAHYESVSTIQEIRHGIERGLTAVGYELKCFLGFPAQDRNRRQKLEHLIKINDAACWLLRAASFETQRWFMKRGIPVLVLGSCYDGINLPNLDFDYRAIGRHAAAMLWRLGHRRLCILTSQYRFGGDILCEQGFKEICLRLSNNTVLPMVRRHNESVGGICRALDICFSKPPLPTALMVAQSWHVLTVISYLMHKGFHIPKQVSLVCRDDDQYLDFVVPAITRYAIDRNIHAKRCVRAVIQLVTGGHLHPDTRLVYARFIRGGTVAAPALTGNNAFARRR